MLQNIKNNFLNKIFIFSLTMLFLFGITFSNILHFYIEDYFNADLVRGIFFDTEYATSLSWMLILSVFFIILTFYQHHIAQKNPNTLTSLWRKNVLIFLAWFSLFISATYTLKIVYIFLSGQSDVYGLLRIGITLGMVILGFVYIWMELRCPDFIKKTIYPVVLSGSIGVLACTGIYCSLAYGSPSLLRLVRKDLSKIDTMKELAYSVKGFFSEFKKLPKNVQEMEDAGFLNKGRMKALNSCTYQVINQDDSSIATFKICTNFKTTSKDARRLQTRDYFESGSKCQVFVIKSKPEGACVMHSVQRPDIRSTINNL